MFDDREVCGTCKYNRRDWTNPITFWEQIRE